MLLFFFFFLLLWLLVVALFFVFFVLCFVALFFFGRDEKKNLGKLFFSYCFFFKSLKGKREKHSNNLIYFIFFSFSLSLSIKGVVVPGYARTKAEELDASNLLLLEATAGEGIVARPLLTRLEMSQSRSVILLPLAYPNERRNDKYFEPTPSTEATEIILQKRLEEFRDQFVKESKEKNYKRAHSTLGLVGAVAYAGKFHTKLSGPTSPSAWLVTMALQYAKAAENVNDRTMKEAKVEDYLRDYRYQDQDVIRLRPGWRFLAPVSFRET